MSIFKKIFDKEIALSKIAQRAKVKLSIDDYKSRLSTKTKSGNSMSRMAHMELAILNKLNVNLGDVIFYVNNGTKASQGDVVKTADKKVSLVNQQELLFEPIRKSNIVEPEVQINCYMLDKDILDNDPNLIGDYNVPRAITTFNKRIEPLLVCFKQEVRDGLIVNEPENRGIFTTAQCELINGMPFEEGDQDKLEEDVLKITDAELSYWERREMNPNYIYDLAEEGWENYIK